MKELFGISMNLIMYVLLVALGLSLSTVAIVALRNRVMFTIGVRNIPRRRPQTILIVIGLMLSTLIISAAFTTGDTIDRSVTSQVYNRLGSVDETIQLRGSVNDQSFEDADPQAVQRDQGFDMTQAQGLLEGLEQEPLIDAVVPMYSEVSVAVNESKRLSSPLFNLSGIDPQRSRELSDIKDAKTGATLHVADLGPGEMFLTRSGASDLNAKAGDTISISAFGKSAFFKVKAVVDDRRLAGSGGVSIRLEGGVVPLSVAQDLFGAPNRINVIAISNKGDVRSGVKYSREVADVARSIASKSSIQLSVLEAKRLGVDFAATAANILTTFFLALGLFSIGAGILLIFMIFVMLAAERKGEMGMVRAIGTKRLDLVQTFLSEGMSYNIIAAGVGCALGVGVAVIIANIMASVFANFDIEISPHVTLRSLTISYSLGVVLTFLTVGFSSWRISNINIVRAIRDIPDPPMQKPNWGARGFWSTVLRLIFKRGSARAWALRAGMFVVAILLFTSAGAAGSVGQVLMILAGSLLFLAFVFNTFQWGALFLAVGILLTVVGASGTSAAPLYFGLSLMLIGLALLARSFGAHERLTYTLAGLTLLYVWLADFQFNLIEKVFGKTNGDIEMFFLSGVMITVASVFLAVYNSDLIVAVLMVVGRRMGPLMPSIRMAGAYPLVDKTRTGMTMAMFCLVVFALIVMSAMNYNFNHVFVSDRALGGWDVTVDENPTNPINDLVATLRGGGSPAPDSFEAVGVTSVANRTRSRVCDSRGDASKCALTDVTKTNVFGGYLVRGEDPGFLSSAKIALQTRATGYASDEQVWQAVAKDPSLVVVDSNALAGQGGFGGGGGFLHGVESAARTMEPTEVSIFDRATQKLSKVTVIGVIELGSSNTYVGIHISSVGFDRVFGSPDYRRFYIKTKAGTNNREVARNIEATLLNTGAQSESLRYQVDQQSGIFASFLRMFQGFMGLGLFVGVAAVGVIAFRTVVERRQQIGMLRALGYTKAMVGLTFVLESAFISFGGIGTGIVFGLVLARFLIHDQFANQGVVDFVIPYTQVAVIGLLSFGSALLMTVLPSRQAASIPIAAALRYE